MPSGTILPIALDPLKSQAATCPASDRTAQVWHDAKNLLAALQGCAWLLRADPCRGEALAHLERIERVIERLESLDP